MKYKKITKGILSEFMQKNAATIDGYEILWSANNVAKHFKTSKYQAGKYLTELVKDGVLKYVHRLLGCDKDYETGICYCENHLHTWGYILK